MASNISPAVTDHLKEKYAAYRRTVNNDAKGLFFAVNCLQICRPTPSYAARDRATIVRYLNEASGLVVDGTNAAEVKGKKKSFATIRPLHADEFEFGTDEQVAPTGFATAAELKRHAEKQGWVGMRVDLWEEEETTGGQTQGTLVKVQYWWGQETNDDEKGWIQVLHDIMYIGPLDETQGSEGDLVKEYRV